MTLFIDNDALLKLASYDLLDTALTMFNIRPEDIHVLATARYALLPAKDRLRHCKIEECASRLESFLAKATKLTPDGLNVGMLDALTSKPGIDPGEALMLGTAASAPDSHIITGDKRALEALQAGKGLDDVCEALAGRVLSLELLFLFLVEGDFAQVQAHVRSRPGVDKALTYAFGVSTPANLDSVRAALDSYVGHLRHLTGSLLHPSPTSS
ncbi:MAG: hypothetical protein KF853_13535 [Rhodocyclaceae bacterium]|nr:hypothetical protein [Rhodocyclaceae bacterium]MBX3678034.1 hypothetical protein [Rhodocyclaceae bacterium]